jgi:N-methylhydantoinase A
VSEPLRIGADVGGTFTDIVAVEGDRTLVRLKVPSTPPRFADAIVIGIGHALERSGRAAADVSLVLHGTTVATNTILEKRGARTGLITMKGFRDVLELRRLRRPELFNVDWVKPEPLVPRQLRLEVDERIDAAGAVIRELDEDEVVRVVGELERLGVESVAICLINSHVNSVHEQRILELVREAGGIKYASASFEISPEINEYERTSSTTINAYLQPVVADYVDDLIQRVSDLGTGAPIRIMQSNGGLLSARESGRVPAAIVESGPAAGVTAAARLMNALGIEDAIAFDMGGTTAKASLIEAGVPFETHEYEVGAGINTSRLLAGGGGYTLRFPSLDIAEVGAGGGSIVWLDALGVPHVGPESAGSTPGPVCYGRGGTDVTVTDANAVLGYLNPESLAGGAQEMHLERATDAVRRQLAEPLERDVEEAAFGVHLLANSAMSRAIRSVTTERGRDPRDSVLIAYGGAGPMHAVQLARDFGIRTVLIPPAPGVFSATGLLLADVTYDRAETVSASVAAGEACAARLDRALERLTEEVLALGSADGWAEDHFMLERFADMRYAGQSFELRIPVPQPPVDTTKLGLLRSAFDLEHQRTYGRAATDEDVEIVNVRVRARQRRATGGDSAAWGAAAVGSERVGPATRSAYFGRPFGRLDTPVITRADLSPVAKPGPLVIEDPDATTIVPPGASAALGKFDVILIDTEVS